MAPPTLVSNPSGLRASPAMLSYLERALEDDLAAAEAGLPTSDQHSSAVCAAFVLGLLSALGAWARSWRVRRPRARATAIPPSFFWKDS
jgi:hypothetical protein